MNNIKWFLNLYNLELEFGGREREARLLALRAYLSRFATPVPLCCREEDPSPFNTTHLPLLSRGRKREPERERESEKQRARERARERERERESEKQRARESARARARARERAGERERA